MQPAGYNLQTACFLMCVEHLQARHHLVRLLLSLLHRALLRPHPHQVSLSLAVLPVGALWLLSAASSAYKRWCCLLAWNVESCLRYACNLLASCRYWLTNYCPFSTFWKHVADPPPPSPPPPSPPPPSPPPPSPPPSESWPCRTCWGGFVAAICS